MTVGYCYNRENNIIEAKVSGKFSLSEFADVMRDICDGKEFSATTSTIWDLRSFEFRSFDSAMTNLLAKSLIAFPQRKGAIVSFIVADQVGYEWIKMFIIMLNRVETSGVFFNYDEAIEWTMRMDKQTIV